ncbi:hypothetical protein BDV29DRAFT_153780 [Aspergillus leporis]|uniref:Uncharacterized protein n=1 Tax=Aspergillus leporis TaxID=41062 RepID=A0A5N5XB91_9EURO|nr:hypothetical protein BDV29DRAFT_153780 [Aspergillus leporis]
MAAGIFKKLSTAVVWIEGCIEAPFPVEPHLKRHTLNALMKRWRTYENFWQDAFGAYTNTIYLFQIDSGVASQSFGQITVCGFWIQSSNGRLAGEAQIPAYNHPFLRDGPEEFLLLAFADLSIGSRSALRHRDEPVALDELLYREDNRGIVPPADGDIGPLPIALDVMLIKRSQETNVVSRLGIG